MSVQITGNLTGTVEGIFNFVTNVNASALLGKPAPSCVFYVEPANGAAKGSWSTVGCTTSVLNGTHARCICNHLTSFAVLVSNHQHSTKDTNAVTLITLIGIGLSLVSIVVTIGTLLSVSLLREQLRYRVRVPVFQSQLLPSSFFLMSPLCVVPFRCFAAYRALGRREHVLLTSSPPILSADSAQPNHFNWRFVHHVYLDNGANN